MNRKIIIGILVAIIITGLGVGSYFWFFQPKKYTGQVEKITLAAYTGEAGAMVYIAEDQGFFEEYGLEVTIKDFGSGKACADAIIADEADVSTSAGFAFVSYSFEHSNLKIFGTVATAEVKELVARKDKGITTIDDLLGKKVGVTKKSGAEFLFGRFLTLNNFTLQDVEIVDLKPLEIVESILNGDIDASFTWDPYSYDIKKELGDNAISWPGGEDFYFVLITKEDWLVNNSVAAERLIKSLLATEEYVKDHSSEAKDFVTDRFEYESDYIEYSWPKQEFNVILSQAMLITFDAQARWKIENNLTNATEIPNYLEYIYLDALKDVKPEAVTIID
jgi:NitT/TauT family transport system substrate-binding protein